MIYTISYTYLIGCALAAIILCTKDWHKAAKEVWSEKGLPFGLGFTLVIMSSWLMVFFSLHWIKKEFIFTCRKYAVIWRWRIIKIMMKDKHSKKVIQQMIDLLKNQH